MRSFEQDGSRSRKTVAEEGLLPIQGEDASSSGERHTLLDRMEAHRVPGVGVAVVSDFEIDWTGSYGTIERDSSTPVSAETLFEIGSTTKMLTAVTALRFVDRGLLDLDADVNAVLTSWKVPDSPLGVAEKVTLRRLLAHQAGFPSSMFEVEENQIPSTAQVLRGEGPAINEPAVLQSVPGSEHAYSNVAYVVIQQVLEDLAGKPFPAIVQENLLDPLGMSRSTFDPLRLPNADTICCHPHDAEGKSYPVSYHPTAVAQGGLWTTSPELARVATDLMNTLRRRRPGVLSVDTALEMIRPQPELDQATFGWTDGQGLGLFLLGRDEGLRFLHPGLNVPGATGLLFAWPTKGFAVALATNGLGGQLLQLEFLRSIGEAYGLEVGL